MKEGRNCAWSVYICLLKMGSIIEIFMRYGYLV